jgi:dimethylhistidine N-methyltransferase
MRISAASPSSAPSPFSDFLEQVLHGLSLPQKSLPSRYFYDAAGSALFEQITELPEYYPTRTEIAILESHSGRIREAIPEGAAIVEFGSGSSRKTELLLNALDAPCAYIPIDISASALYPAAERIRQKFPGIAVHPVLASFEDIAGMTLKLKGPPRVGFFPGSTIGNLSRTEAISFLGSARRYLGSDARFIAGADLQKPLGILLPAYDDAQGVTAAFNRNILVRINRELDGTFNPCAFEHRALYNGAEHRIEMHLLATGAQRVSVAGRVFTFEDGETIHTENSHKYTLEGFQAMARAGGWQPAEAWIDKKNLFSIHLLG